jgi:hypothetical protein
MVKINNIPPDLNVSDRQATVPQALMNCSRKEFGKNGTPKLRLNIKEGTLPTDLHGHVFIVSPVGFGDSIYGQGLAIFNGDGMIYRLDLDTPGEVSLKTEIAHTPCYYADNAIQAKENIPSRYRFKNWGLMRYSLLLGLRDSLNTAFLSMPFPSQDRLLVTFDAGRPYEIDTDSLKVVTPVGSNREWQTAIPIPQPFPAHLSTAHPAFDRERGEMFTINYGRSAWNFLDTIPGFEMLSELPTRADETIGYLARLLEWDFLQPVTRGVWQGLKDGIDFLGDRATAILPQIRVPDFLYLLRWDGEGKIERWKLVDDAGNPIKITQSVHQIGVSKDYIVIIDTAFKVGVEQLLNNPLPDNEPIEKILRVFLTRPQSSDSKIYIVRRQDLETIKGQLPAASNSEVTIVAKQVTLPLETIHFLVDYDNPDGEITLQIAHNCATDVSEVVRPYDESAYQKDRSLPTRLNGMLAIGQMDVNRIGRYKINGETGAIADAKVIHNDLLTFGVGLYTYRERLSSGGTPSKLDNIYWQSWGFWQELMPKFIFDLYKNYRHRMISSEEMADLPNLKPKPVCLFRVETESMNFVDYYQFERGYMMSSPQFVPRNDNNDSSTNGYIFCNVLTPENDEQDEVWIFKADDLKSGPICKLTHPEYKVGYTIHTTWLPKIAPRTTNYCIRVKEDYQELLKRADETIKTLFEEDIYPHFQ